MVHVAIPLQKGRPEKRDPPQYPF